jgi:Tfp pilus assembly protein PilV
MMRPRSRRRGLALLEALVAVTVLGVGLGGALSALSESTRQESALGRKATARHLAADQMLKLELSRALVQNAELSGKFDPPYADYAWTARVQSSSSEQGRWHAEVTILSGAEHVPAYRLDKYYGE